jgi:hypothetical protein
VRFLCERRRNDSICGENWFWVFGEPFPASCSTDGGKGAAIGTSVGAGAGFEIITKGDRVKVPSEI